MPALNARFIATVKPAEGRRLEFTDHEVRGLTFRLTENGVKSWLLRYRLGSGERRKLTLGAYPALGLADARNKAIVALAHVAEGGDPAAEKAASRRAARTNRLTRPQTLEELWRFYDRIHISQKRPHTQTYVRWLWRKHLSPRLGATPLAEVDRPTLKAAFRDIGADAATTANKALSVMRHMLNVAVEEEFLKANPLAGLGALFQENSRERVLSDQELRALWAAFEAAPGRMDLHVSDRTCLALKLALATAARGGEVVGLHVRELNFETRTWTIPSARTKNGRAHTIPLSPLAWSLIEHAFGAAQHDWAGYVFPLRGDSERPMERANVTRAMNRITTAYEIPRATPHDLRRTAATYMASERIGAAPHLITAVLGHASDGARATQVYNRHRYDREKRQVLEAWASTLCDIVLAPKAPLRVA